MGRHGIPRIDAPLITEGDALEPDGLGTLLATASSIVNDDRNPGRTRARLTTLLESTFGLTEVIWFTGVKDKDITDFLASYANYYVINGAVLVPQLGDTSADAAAEEILAAQYPGRDIVQLDIDNLAAGGGGIHCATQQQPDLSSKTP